jgi:putative peptidoglycan lipid II flippase
LTASWKRPGASGLFPALVVVLGSSATALVLGFIKNIVAAFYYGTSGAMDAYLMALLLPDVAMQFARTGAFNFIPLFAAERQRSEAEAWQAAGKMLSYWLLLLAGTLLLVFLLAPLALSLLARGYGPEQRAATLELIQILLLMAATMGTGKILGVVLHGERRFLMAGLSEVAFQLGSMAFLVAYHGLGIRALAWAQVFGGSLQLLVASCGLFANRRLLRAGLDLGSAPVRRMIRLSLPVYLGDSGDKINLVVTRAFGSLLPAGAISALQYGYTPVEGLHRMFAGPLATALFPFLSRRFAEGDPRRARTTLGRTVVLAAVVFLPLTAVAWLFSHQIVVLIFQRGSFDVGSTQLTSSALRLFAPSVLALALNELLASSFHARQDTMVPMRAGLVRVVCSTALCALLIPSLGHRGIALATTLSLYVKLLVLGFCLRRVFEAAELRRQLAILGRVLLAAAVMTAAVYPLSVFATSEPPFANHALRTLAGLGLVCVVVYAAALRVFARRPFVLTVALARRVLLRRWLQGAPRKAAPGPARGAEKGAVRP